MMHTILFPREPARACESIVVYIDLETNSLDVLSGKIVEIGALVDGSRATFSTVVHPGRDAPLDDASVHGIPHEELLSGPSFTVFSDDRLAHLELHQLGCQAKCGKPPKSLGTLSGTNENVPDACFTWMVVRQKYNLNSTSAN